MPAPSPIHQRARAAALRSQEDLLRDQLQFFSENDAIERSPDADPEQLEQQYLAAVSRATDDQTPSSALLPTIEERPVSRRRRSRRKNVNATRDSVTTPFPQSFQADLSRPSLFARRERETHDVASSDVPSSSCSTPTSAQATSSMLASVSLQQERETQHEMCATLEPESISILKQHSTQEVNSQEHAPSSDSHPSEAQKRVSTNNSVSPKRWEASSSNQTPSREASAMLASMSLQQIREAQQEIYSSLKPESISFLKQRSSKQFNSQSSSSRSFPVQTACSGSKALPVSSSREQAHRSVTKANEAEHDHVERAKRLWMTDATETLETQEHVDEVLQKAVQDMGPIATERFDLDGNLLTEQQIDALPTHKGLHHHGTSPESAGYTLADLLILTRSTILSQRVIALRVLTALISRHGERVIEPMLNSDGVKLVFSPLPAAEKFHSALTNQVAYLEAVECLLRQFCSLDQHMLSRDYYFASEFYSPPFVQENESSLFGILSEMHCIGTLVEIAEARCTILSSVEYSKRALNAIRIIILNSRDASQRLLAEGESTNTSRVLNSLMRLAIGSDRLAPSTTMLSCDIIANVIVKAVWTSKDKLQEVFKQTLSEYFLMETAVHLSWVLRDNPFELSSTEQEAAKGVLRLFRAYLSQNWGVRCISTFLQAICRLVREADDNLGVEAYLLLEAYVHCLATKMMHTPERQYDVSTSEERSRSARAKDPSLAKFANDQLSGLTPQVVAAAKVVAATGNQHTTPRRAAAGHFVATALAVMSVPFDETYYSQLKCIASEVNFRIAKSGLGTRQRLTECQALASLSHATARILNGKLFEKGFALQEVRELIDAAVRERKAMPIQRGREGGWRLIANACAEWLGLLSRLDYTPNIAQTASVLLPCLNDAQVILDLISRGLLRKEILLALGRGMEASEAEKIAQKFIPLTWKLLNDDSELRSELLQKSGDSMNDPALVSLDSLVRLWLKHDGLTSDGLKLCRLLLKSDLLDKCLLFESLVELPLTQCPDPPVLFDFMLEVGQACVETEGRLIRPVTNTKRSDLSTSVDSQFSNAVLSLTDHLVARGPTPLSSSKETVDSLGSIILTIMCGLEADSTLRQNMWSRCVEECGGAVLFENGLFLHPINTDPTFTDTRLEKEDMIYRYISAVSNAYLDPGRCPDIIRRVFLFRLAGYLSFPDSRATLENLFQSFSPVSRRTATAKIHQFLATDEGNNFEYLAQWVRIML